MDCGVNPRWAAVYQAVARRMMSYLDNSEALKVDTKELKDHVLASSGPIVDIDHLARQTRGEQRQILFHILSRQGAKEILVASVAIWVEHLRMLIVMERRCLDLSEAIEREAKIVGHSDGEQEVCVQKKTLPMDFRSRSSRSWMSWRSRSQKRHWSYWDVSTRCKNWKMKGIDSLAHDVDEAMSTFSRKSRSMEKERDWWSADLEDEMEKLEVEGTFSVAEGRSMDPKRKADHWPAPTVLTKKV